MEELVLMDKLKTKFLPAIRAVEDYYNYDFLVKQRKRETQAKFSGNDSGIIKVGKSNKNNNWVESMIIKMNMDPVLSKLSQEHDIVESCLSKLDEEDKYLMSQLFGPHHHMYTVVRILIDIPMSKATAYRHRDRFLQQVLEKLNKS